MSQTLRIKWKHGEACQNINNKAKLGLKVCEYWSNVG